MFAHSIHSSKLALKSPNNARATRIFHSHLLLLLNIKEEPTDRPILMS